MPTKIFWSLTLAAVFGLCWSSCGLAQSGPTKKPPVEAKKPASAAPAKGAAESKGGAGDLPWTSEDQKKMCEGLLPGLNENFLKARDASIYGDPCASGEHAGLFLSDADKARKECPEGFLKRNGFHERVIKNVKTLHILGKRRCKRFPDSPPPAGAQTQ
jgi:hypothetical protein